MNSLNNSKQLIQPRFSRSAGTTGVHSRVSMKGEERFHNNAWTFIFNVRSRWEIRLDSAIVNYASRIKRVDFLVRVKIGFRSIRDERVLKWTWTNVSAGNGILAFRDDSKFDRSNEVPTTANNASSQRLIRADAWNYFPTEFRKRIAVGRCRCREKAHPTLSASRCEQFYASTVRVYYKSWSRHMARMEREGSSRWKLPRLLESFAQGEEGSPSRGGDPALLFAPSCAPTCSRHASKHRPLVPGAINPFFIFTLPPRVRGTSHYKPAYRPSLFPTGNDVSATTFSRRLPLPPGERDIVAIPFHLLIRLRVPCVESRFARDFRQRETILREGIYIQRSWGNVENKFLPIQRASARSFNSLAR